MAKIKENDFLEEEIETILAEDIKFKGTLKFSKTLMIKGDLDGKIIAETGHLFSGKKATIHADIIAENVSNRGAIYGNIKAEDKYELFSTGITKGDVTCKDLYVESGAKFNGKSNMKITEKKKNSEKVNNKPKNEKVKGT